MLGVSRVSSVVLISSEIGGSLVAVENPHKNLWLSDVKLWHLNLVILVIKIHWKGCENHRSCMKKHVYNIIWFIWYQEISKKIIPESYVNMRLGCRPKNYKGQDSDLVRLGQVWFTSTVFSIADFRLRIHSLFGRFFKKNIQYPKSEDGWFAFLQQEFEKKMLPNKLMLTPRPGHPWTLVRALTSSVQFGQSNAVICRGWVLWGQVHCSNIWITSLAGSSISAT